MEVSGQQLEINSQVFSREHTDRRSANYEPNIWKHDFLQTLSTTFHEEEYKREVAMLKVEIQSLFNEAVDLSAKLELVDCLKKLGLHSYFEDEIKIVIEAMTSFDLNNGQALYFTALSFKLLRLHGYHVSKDVLSKLMDETGISLSESKNFNIRGIMELLEASHLAQEGETVLEFAKILSTKILKDYNWTTKGKFSDNIAHSLEIPSHWRAEWFDVKWQIEQYELQNMNKCVINLAKLNFNVVQATLQHDLKDISRWWKNLGLIENIDFSRDRLVESFLCSVGLGFEPKHSKFRKWLTKVVIMILVIDDVFDIYGSLDELHVFTHAVQRWEITSQLQNLPKCIQLCFEALYNMTNEMTSEICCEKGFDFALTQTHLKKAWGDFCESLLVEATWFKKGYIPTLEEYLKNGRISSSGCLLSVHSLFFIMDDVTSETLHYFLGRNQDLILNISLIIRFCNDLGTSMAEQERGDVASSIICYMREMNVSEEAATSYIKGLINSLWKKINGKCFTNSTNDYHMKLFVNIVTNMARVTHNLYQDGDGFGAQGQENKKQILSLLVHPLKLN